MAAVALGSLFHYVMKGPNEVSKELEDEDGEGGRKMIRNPKDLTRYNAQERANHWLVGICFILLALSGLAFFHPAFYPLVQLFGGGVWARILHPFIGVVMALAFLVMFFRFKSLNAMTAADKEWLSRAGEMVTATTTTCRNRASTTAARS
jgi:formate dehydrogenase gamma subunit